ncbi:hypothetical protein CBW65_05695 [Tumebacillus avium]|uniref:Uncharacterized protein n=1 Tax=Tumebacillus avium TaxID=1903704 RepID=A0A1Y0IMN9_9BACL|nr:hypothetical protein [Tumebacillus avium]ARU60633.1 hypothetical protein CBW65_05695 [Tumebacillus avium]
MNETYRTSIVLYGEIDLEGNAWLSWLEYCKDLAEKLGFPPNYLGVTGEAFKSGKILSLSRTQNRLKKSIVANEEFESVAVYSLPSDFNTAIFDYDLYFVRTRLYEPSHLMVSMSSEVFEKIEVNELLSELKKHISFVSGEIFMLSKEQSSGLYAAKVNPPASFRSLRVIEELR